MYFGNSISAVGEYIKLGLKNIEKLNNYTYLGHIIHGDLKDNEDIASNQKNLC